MRLSPNGPPANLEIDQPRIVTGDQRGNRAAPKANLDLARTRQEIERLKKQISDMKQGFENIRARRCSPAEKQRELLRHGVRFNKLNHKLFRLRQAALPFDRDTQKGRIPNTPDERAGDAGDSTRENHGPG
jgi:hypothetical protein